MKRRLAKMPDGAHARGDKDFGVMCQILTDVRRDSDRMWRNLRDGNDNNLDIGTTETYRRLSEVMAPMKEADFQKEVERTEAHLQLKLPPPANKNLHFYLPPLERNSEFVITFSSSCDLGRAPWDIDFRIHMYRLLGYPQTTGGQASQFERVTFRFEGPETMPAHHFYHAQLTPAFGCPNWLPSSIPCLPLAANNPVSLLVCLMMSLYGRKMFNQLLVEGRRDGRYRDLLAQVLPAIGP